MTASLIVLAAVLAAPAPVFTDEECMGCHADPATGTTTILDPTVVDRSRHRALCCTECHRDIADIPHAETLPKVNCGACHGREFSWKGQGAYHDRTFRTRSRAARIVRDVYSVLIAVIVGLMLLHNLVDFARKLVRSFRESADGEIRMDFLLRMQHLLHIAAFALLAWTGFSRTFPGAWFAAPFRDADLTRRILHRMGAAAFVILTALHVLAMLRTHSGRSLLRELRPRLRDLREAVTRPLTGKPSPGERPWSYVEKVEYWSLIWGSTIVILTGIVLLLPSLLGILPLWLYDAAGVVHLMEAGLAVLALAVWHGYHVVFDPDVYPMNWSWITGSRKRRWDHEGKEDS